MPGVSSSSTHERSAVGVMRVHLTGAAGAGVSSVGAHLGSCLGVPHFDTDSFYWDGRHGQFERKRPVTERLHLLRQVCGAATRGWVLSGSLGEWGNPLLAEIDAIVFVVTPTGTRLRRIVTRERLRFGASVARDGAYRMAIRDFVHWAGHYDSGTATGRSLARHEAWLANADKPVLRIDGGLPTARNVEVIVDWLGGAVVRDRCGR